LTHLQEALEEERKKLQALLDSEDTHAHSAHFGETDLMEGEE
jgi:hypothetical protein